jgi:GH15 family glucan-1,4-alpha-glucosidase
MERGWELQRWLAGRLQEAWKRPDNGIWESRGERQHFVYSKVMCWVAFDSLVKGVERFGLDGPVERWRAVRDEIHSDVLEKGYDTDRGTFTQAYGFRALDACALLIPRVGFLPHDDERVISTVETIRDELTEDGLVLRYRTEESDDGLAGREGSFLICSFWMVYALWGIGRKREAEELFGRLLALRNDVGLLSEEYDTRAQRLVGNFPQAFTHLALVNCALRLSESEVSSAARE